jgi:hypothetical protein
MSAHRKCTICGKPIILAPSAAERSRRDPQDRPPSYYLDLFTEHVTCAVAKRGRETLELIERRNKSHDRQTLG